MDVDGGESGPIPVSPVTFKAQLSQSVQLIPVVFIVNAVLKNQTTKQLDDLSGKIIHYVNRRIQPSGKATYNELQIDCDWTRTTRDNYFYLLKRIKQNAALKGKAYRPRCVSISLRTKKAAAYHPLIVLC